MRNTSAPPLMSLKKISASLTVKSSTSLMLLSTTFTSRTSARKRVPSQSGQRKYTSDKNCISTCSKPEPEQVAQRPLPALKLKVPAVYARSTAIVDLAKIARIASNAPTKLAGLERDDLPIGD